MCGIVAAVGRIDPPLCRRMLGRLAHRGPDDTGEFRSGQVWLGHQRLSIVDLDAGHQPLVSIDGEARIAANGEIYNQIHLREELGPELFWTSSDSEAALQAILVDGPVGLTRLNGMFAIAYLGADGRFLAARDPVGIKPLYWARRPDVTLFASELRAFEPEDRPLVEEFPPGCCWTPTAGLVRFADAVPVPVRPARHPGDLWSWDERLVKAVREAVVGAVEERMMGDVGIGVFLSGGLDSAIVAAAAAAYAFQHGAVLPTFAVGSADSSDLAAARVVAEHLGTEHHEVIMTAETAAAALPQTVRVIEHYDPSLVRSAVPNLLLSEYAAKRVPVVLTGEGADELFAGYGYYHDGDFAAPDALQAELVRTMGELHHLNLQRCDRTTMAYGLEGRVPFLDDDLIALALSIPPEFKAAGDGVQEKKLLREAFTGWLPEEILYREKLQFGDGSGAADLLDAAVETFLAGAEPAPPDDPDVTLRTPEEAAYYGIWREEFAGIRVGRTLGMFATT